ncbi:MAG: hypothetical protein NT092_01485 [Bacteroidia bacterium]|nr:hypothetical protein [Bacteroidia bacterium]
MKTLNFKNTNDLFADFTLSKEEMIKVRGGDGADPTIKPPIPPVKI